MVFKGPNFDISTPFSKSPRKYCKLSSDYDCIDFKKIDSSNPTRAIYAPLITTKEFDKLFKGFVVGHEDEKVITNSWLNQYKIAFRKRLNISQCRTLIGAILPMKSSHVDSVISIIFRKLIDDVELLSLASSLILDFYIKIIGASDLMPSRMQSFPLGIPQKYQSAMYSRTLLLNCLTVHYADLWQSCWRPGYAQEEWSLSDPRLKPFTGLTEEWTWDTPLRNYFERRQALVEIDVLAAMALGLSLKDLELIYTIQFPVLQQNENDTWYDTKGNIVFTCSSGLKGVGCDSKEWKDIRGKASEDGMTYEGTAPTYVHTIDPKKSEMYGGEEVTYYAPYTKCDRIADYRRAWAFFDKKLNNK